MAVHSGKNGKVKVGANTVLKTRRWSIRETVSTDDTTAQGDTSQNHVVGIPGWSGSIDVLHDPADTTGQEALTIGASVTLGLYSDGDATGKKYYSGTATITDISVDAPMGAVTRSLTILGNGDIDKEVVI